MPNSSLEEHLHGAPKVIPIISSAGFLQKISPKNPGFRPCACTGSSSKGTVTDLEASSRRFLEHFKALFSLQSSHSTPKACASRVQAVRSVISLGAGCTPGLHQRLFLSPDLLSACRQWWPRPLKRCMHWCGVGSELKTFACPARHHLSFFSFFPFCFVPFCSQNSSQGYTSVFCRLFFWARCCP